MLYSNLSIIYNSFMSDHEAWMELADLYISQNQ